MKLLADENIDGAIVEHLESLGHDVIWMSKAAPGTPDGEVIVRAVREGRVIVTFDLDFGELVFHSGQAAPGVILLRLEVTPPELMRDAFTQVWGKVEGVCQGHFVVATNKKIRIRPIGRQ